MYEIKFEWNKTPQELKKKLKSIGVTEVQIREIELIFPDDELPESFQDLEEYENNEDS